MKIQWFIHCHTNDLVILAAIRSTLARCKHTDGSAKTPVASTEAEGYRTGRSVLGHPIGHNAGRAKDRPPSRCGRPARRC